MAPPIPSFFKIRLSIIICILILFFLLIGAVKQALSVGHIGANGECYGYFMHSSSGPGWNAQVRKLIEVGGPYYLDSAYYTIQDYAVSWGRYIWNGTEWQNLGYQSGLFVESSEHSHMLSVLSNAGGSENVYPSTYAPNGCVDENPCAEEFAAKALECGDDANVVTIDEENCVFACAPCDMADIAMQEKECEHHGYWHETDLNACTVTCRPIVGADCDDELAALSTECGERGVQAFDYETCIGYCNNNCNVAYELLSNKCGGAGVGAFNWNTCEGVCDECKERKETCKILCATKGGTYQNDCYQTTKGTVVDTCECNDTIVDPPDEGYDPYTSNPDTDGVDPDPVNEDPDAEDPETTPDTDTDKWLKAVKKALEEGDRKKIAELEAMRGNQDKALKNQGDIIEHLGVIDKNAKVIADNTKRTTEAVEGLRSDLAEKEFTADMTGLEDGLDDLEGELDDLGESISDLEDAIEGTTGPTEDLDTTEPEEYVVEEHDFGSRTSSFFNEMKTTGLFSVPTAFFDSIPGGGTPQFTIEGGETFGTHILDFSDFSSGLLALRAVIQIAFMWLAIRIVTLKR